jgi:hypothetical protein
MDTVLVIGFKLLDVVEPLAWRVRFTPMPYTRFDLPRIDFMISESYPFD